MVYYPLTNREMGASKRVYQETIEQQELFKSHVTPECEIEIDVEDNTTFCSVHGVELFGVPERDYDPDDEYQRSEENNG